ncbi:MAG: CsgG/HfaB family protein [Thermoanaerobaculia bacterium]
MKLSSFFVFLLFTMSLISQPRVVVLEFVNKSLAGHHYWWDDRVGAAAQDMLITELVKSKQFRVIERERLDAIMKEKGLVLSGDIDPSTAMKIGKLLGAEYLIAGSVTEFGKTEKEARGAWGIGFGAKKTEFVSALDARLFSVNTGEILWADSASEKESNFNLEIFGTGGGVDKDERLFDKVLRPVVKKLAQSLLQTPLQTSTAIAAVSGKVASVSGNTVYINLGSSHNIKPGQTLGVYKIAKEIKDPDTGEVLGREEKKVGEIKIVEVKGEKLSEATIISGSAEEGNIVK